MALLGDGLDEGGPTLRCWLLVAACEHLLPASLPGEPGSPYGEVFAALLYVGFERLATGAPGGKFLKVALDALAVCFLHVGLLVVESSKDGKSSAPMKGWW
jgi:hypothetical protein